MGSLAGYEKLIGMVQGTCARLSLPLTSEANDRIVTIILGIHHADNYIDAAPREMQGYRQAEILSLFESASPEVRLKQADPETVEAMNRLKLLVNHLPPERKRCFQCAVQQIFSQGPILASARDGRAFLSARLKEGTETGNLIIACVDEFWANRAYAGFMRRFMANMNLVDTLKDYTRDRRAHLIDLPVTGLFSVAASLVGRLVVSAKHKPDRQVSVGLFKLLGHAAVQKIRASGLAI